MYELSAHMFPFLTNTTQVLELSRNLQNEQAERQRMQDAVDVACVGLERESMALRAEVAAAVSANRVLQAQASHKMSQRRRCEHSLFHHLRDD